MEMERELLREKGIPALHTESVGDYTLPDYNTDVKRVLLTKAVASDTGCFLNGDAIDVTGVVNYEVVYIDSEGEITSCQFSTDYDASLKCNGEVAVGCEAFTRVSNFSARLVGPRRFSVKAQLVTDVNLTEKATVGVEGSAFSLGEPEMRTTSARVAHRAYAAPYEKNYTETVNSIEGVIADDVVVLYSDLKPDVSASASDGMINVSGVLHLNALVKCGDEIPTAVSCDVAVDENLAADGVDADCGASAFVRVNSLRVEVSPDEDGVSLIASFNAEYSASAISNAEMPVILDCYLVDREVENSYEGYSYTEHICSTDVRETLTFTAPFSELGVDSLREVLLANAYMRIDEITATENGAKMSGIIRFSGVACQINEDGSLGFVGIKQDEPFSINVNVGCHLSADSRFSFRGGVASASAVTSADGVMLSADVRGTLEVLSTTTLTRLCASVADEEAVSHDGTVITVYYPTEGETLFDVGRKFHTRPIDIAADNSLTEEVFSSIGSDLCALGVKRLIIR